MLAPPALAYPLWAAEETRNGGRGGGAGRAGKQGSSSRCRVRRELTCHECRVDTFSRRFNAPAPPVTISHCSMYARLCAMLRGEGGGEGGEKGRTQQEAGRTPTRSSSYSTLRHVRLWEKGLGKDEAR